MFTEREYYTYIMCNDRNTVLYTGISGCLESRVRQHKLGVNEGFTKKYRIKKLVYYEVYGSPLEAIQREKQIKGYRRSKKEALINSMNPEWKDLSAEWGDV